MSLFFKLTYFFLFFFLNGNWLFKNWIGLCCLLTGAFRVRSEFSLTASRSEDGYSAEMSVNPLDPKIRHFIVCEIIRPSNIGLLCEISQNAADSLAKMKFSSGP